MPEDTMDNLTVKEMDLIYREEFHEKDAEEMDCFLDDIQMREQAEKETEEAWARFREREEKKAA